MKIIFLIFFGFTSLFSQSFSFGDKTYYILTTEDFSVFLKSYKKTGNCVVVYHKYIIRTKLRAGTSSFYKKNFENLKEITVCGDFTLTENFKKD